VYRIRSTLAGLLGWLLLASASAMSIVMLLNTSAPATRPTANLSPIPTEGVRSGPTSPAAESASPSRADESVGPDR
jgi:hypothetical protein